MTTTTEPTQIIKDMRPGYGGQITIKNGNPLFAGIPINELIKDESDPRKKHHYNIIIHGINYGTICLNDNDFTIINDLLEGIRFVPTNCYSPNHWTVKHIVYGFEGFDTRSEYNARRKASLTNQIGIALENNNKLKEKDVLIPATLRLLGFTD